MQDPRLSVEASRYRREEGAAAMAELLERAETFDAVRCFNDAVALGALECLRERGVRVPEDVAVIGLDDVEEARHSTPTLSSVSPDRAMIAQVAVRLLHDRLTGAAPEEPVRRVIEHHLEVRGSTTVAH